MLRGNLLSLGRLSLRSPFRSAAHALRQAVEPSRYLSSSSRVNMAPKKDTATKQIGLGAFLKKGVVMVGLAVQVESS
jgi:hypothetical protein